MWPLTFVLFAICAGFFAGHGADLPIELVPLVVAIVTGFLALKATEQVSS
jgi:hypothetical protein